MLYNALPRQPQVLTVAAVFLAACFLGLVVPIYVGILGEYPSRLMALPALMLLGFLLLFSRKFLFLLIIVLRSSGDIFLNETKLSIGGYAIGVGGLINAFVLFIAFLLVVEKPSVLPKKLVTIIWMPFLLVAAYAVVISPVRLDAVRLYLSQISYFAIFVSAFYFVRSREDFRFCVSIALWASVLPALYALVDIALNLPGAGLGAFRLKSTFMHPNQFAFFLTMMLLLALYLLKSTTFILSPIKRLGLMTYMLFLLALLLLTKTRSAWAACFAVFGAYALFFERRYLFYLMTFPFLAFLVPGVRDRILDVAAGNEYMHYAKLDSFTWRRLMWESALNWMRPDRYLFGYGLDAFKFYSPVFFPLAGQGKGAHSVYVQWFFEMGAAGVAAFLWLFVRVLWLLKSMVQVDKMAAFTSIALVVAYLIVSFADNMPAYLAFNWYFWFVVAAAIAIVKIESRSQPTAERRVDVVAADGKVM